MKKLLLIASLALTACTPDATDITHSSDWRLPQGLRDCKLYWLSNSVGNGMHVMRCPNSTTSVSESCGKSTCENTTIDGGY